VEKQIVSFGIFFFSTPWNYFVIATKVKLSHYFCPGSLTSWGITNFSGRIWLLFSGTFTKIAKSNYQLHKVCLHRTKQLPPDRFSRHFKLWIFPKLVSMFQLWSNYMEITNTLYEYLIVSSIPRLISIIQTDHAFCKVWTEAEETAQHWAWSL
jgi:hypothetical protein